MVARTGRAGSIPLPLADQELFRRCADRGCGHVFGLSRGELDPLALMLSADPLPRSRQRTWCADNAAGFRINPLPAHHLLVTPDSCAALALGEPRPRTLPTLLTPEFPDRPSCPSGSQRRCAPSC